MNKILMIEIDAIFYPLLMTAAWGLYPLLNLN